MDIIGPLEFFGFVAGHEGETNLITLGHEPEQTNKERKRKKETESNEHNTHTYTLDNNNNSNNNIDLEDGRLSYKVGCFQK
jgi:hypothetical protein